MDETMYFDIPGNTTVDKVGSKTVSVKTTGYKRQHFTVVLACQANRKKIQPLVIFMWKNIPKRTFPPGVVVKVHSKGWMDEALIKVWTRWFAEPRSLLV